MLSRLLLLVLPIFITQSAISQSTLMNLVPSNTATHTAIQSGDWFNVATWDTGTIPDDAAIVFIPAGFTVDYEGQSDAHIFAIRVDGEFICEQTTATDTTKIIFDTFVGTMNSKVQFHAQNGSDGYIDVAISPFDIEAHKAGTSGYPQIWNADAISHFSDGATTYEVTYDVGPDSRFPTYAQALAGNTSVTELTRNAVSDGAGVLGRHEWDSTQLSLGLVTMGEIEVIGQAKSVMAKLSADAAKNQPNINMETSPQGWEVGDEILITRGGNQGESSAGTETAIINTISGNTITTAQNLTKNHGGRPADSLHCYVGNLNRNISFYSTNPSVISQRGHFMAMHNPTNIQVKNAAFLDMGRTDKSRLLDDLIWSHWVEPVVFQSYVSALGQECSQLVTNPKADITNHRGRYSIHIHKAGATNGTNMAQVTGNVVRGNPGWAITHHDSHANVSDNVVYDVTGGGIVSEVGNETGFWDNNLVVDVKVGHNFDVYKSFLFYGDYLFEGQGLAMKGRGVVCRNNVIVEANEGVGIFNMSATINSTQRMDSDALATLRPGFTFDQFPLDKNGYSAEGDGIIPQEVALILENTTMVWCGKGLRSIERDPGVNHESRSIFDKFWVWGANWGLRINYQADYSFRDVFISGKNATSQGIVMYKHAHNMVYERMKLVDMGYGIVASKLHDHGTNGDVKTRNTGFTPWLFIDLELENVTNMYYVTYQDPSNVPYDEHPDNAIHLSSTQLPTTRPITFTLNSASDLEIDLASGDLEFRVDGAITDRAGTYEFGITQAASMDNLRIDYDERIYEFDSQAKLEEYLTNNGIYKDTADNDQLYFIINEYVPDRTTFEYRPFPIRIKILNAPNSGVFANPQIENAANFEPTNQLISRAGTASQSSTSTSESFKGVSIDPHANKAIDGNNNARKNVHFYQVNLLPIGSSAITKVELEPWWDLDLGESKIIEHVDIWNTVDMHGQDIETPSPHFRNFYVMVSDSSFTGMDLATARASAKYEYYKDGNPLRWLALNDLNIKGRYLRIQVEGYGKIGIAEVDVIGRNISDNADCHGDIGGLAYLDECGTCVKGNTGLDPCKLDCNNDWGGTAFINNCGTCVGGNTGKTNPVEIPCNGIDDDCDPLTPDTDASNDSDGDGVCDSEDVCAGSPEPGTSCDNGVMCISNYQINEDCNCVGAATIPSGLNNLAINKPTSQSSIKDGAEASRAVDGNTDGVMANGSVTYTNFDQNAWWEVDLEAVEDIGLINIYNRTDCCKNRLSNFYVFVSAVPFVSTDPTEVMNQSGVSSYYVTEKPNPSIGIAINVQGRYVRVQLAGTHFLSLAEVEVIELCSCAADTDMDGVCDVDDICPGYDDNIDSDGDGTPDGCDTCNNNLIGTSCNDGNDCTYNDVIQSDCSCAGTLYYSATQKINNRSFETGDFQYWERLVDTIVGTSNISVNTTNPYCEGTYAVEYSGAGSVYEQLYTDVQNLIIGDSYTLYFQMIGSGADCYIGPTYDVFSGTLFNPIGGMGAYTQQSLTFTASENTMRIWFSLAPSASITLDAFSFEDNSCSTCSDGIMNGEELGIDCGGPSCAPCIEGCMDSNAHNYDPVAEVDFCFCETCDDGELNGDETEIDCGGSCQPCGTICTISETKNDIINSGSQTVAVSDTITSTAQISGSADVQYFAEKTILLKPDFTSISGSQFLAKIQDCDVDCSDGIMNGDETGIDCGGSICPACPTCSDGIQNGDEGGVDCGGANCPACPTCVDGIQNGDETGIDCGGSCATCAAPCLIVQILNDTISFGSHLFNVTDTLTSSAVYSGTANIEYNAGKSVILKTGFSSSSGTQFLAKILTCVPPAMSESNDEITEAILIQNKEATKEDLSQKVAPPYILIYPNPTNADLQIQIKTERPQPIEISIQNALGRVMTQKKEDNFSPIFQTDLNVYTYPPGIYWLKIRFVEDGAWQVIQFVKQ